jgi:hypothetical protein
MRNVGAAVVLGGRADPRARADRRSLGKFDRALDGGDLDGGDERTRTADPLLAKQVLYQLSYVPVLTCGNRLRFLRTPLAEQMIRRVMSRVEQVMGISVQDLSASFLRSLRAENKSRRTVETYSPAHGAPGNDRPRLPDLRAAERVIA